MSITKRNWAREKKIGDKNSIGEKSINLKILFLISLRVSDWLPCCSSYSIKTRSLLIHGRPYHMEVTSKQKVQSDTKYSSRSFGLRLRYLSWIDSHLVVLTEINDVLWACHVCMGTFVALFDRARIVYRGGHTVDVNEKAIYLFTVTLTICKSI